jgi:hypothetical protein
MKKENFWGFILILTIVLCVLYSCKNDLDFSIAQNPVGLSKDTILFDTVLTSSRSQTYKLLLYNKENHDIEIPKIYLEKGNSSLFKININGIKSSSASNVALRNKDSLYVFIELSASDIMPNESIYEDKIIIETLSGLQNVTLQSFIEKAIYLYPKNNNNELLIESNQIWDSNQSYVIHKNVRFSNNSKLTIGEGTKIYFHENSRLVFSDNSQLVINGSVDKKVIFRSDKHSSDFENLPNQWGSIEIEKGSKASISNAIIQGGKTGLRIDEAEVDLTNVQLYNHTNQGIYATNATIVAKNLAINNCGGASLKIEKGGDYQFYHCTFANYWNLSSFSTTISVSISNRFNFHGIELNKPLTRCVFGNCIVEGNAKNSLIIDKFFDDTLAFNYKIDFSLIKYQDNPNEVYLDSKITNSIINGKALFVSTSFAKNNLRLNNTSDATNKGGVDYTQIVSKNIEGKPRISPSNLGAY